VVQGDWEIVVVEVPEFMEHELGLQARIDEDQRRTVLADERVDLRHQQRARVAGEGQRLVESDHADVGLGAALHDDEVGETSWRRICRCRAAIRANACGIAAPLRHQITAEVVRLAHGRRKADGRETGRERVEPREPEGEEIATLRRDEGVQFVEDDALETAEQLARVAVGQEQRQLLGRRQQDVGRSFDLARALVGRRVAGARLDPDRQRHVEDGHFQVSGDVDREGLERRDVEGVEYARAGVRVLHLFRSRSREA
jgi:hypothetical protein